MTLQEIWHSMPIKTDKGDVHSYLPIYEEILKPYRSTATDILEIGIFNGASLLLWEKYFDNAKIHGIDCSDQPIGGMADLRPMIASGEHNIYIGDATSMQDAFKFFGQIKFDVIIDDGSHALVHQIQSYMVYSNFLNEGGIYIIEDIQDIDKEREIFEDIDSDKTVEIIDNRHVKNRYDDVIVIIK